jgi:hypothetical protein
MSIEQYIAELLQKKLEDGSIEKVIEDKLTKCIGECMEDMFRWSGEAKKLIEEKLKETMIPAIERHDFNDYTLMIEDKEKIGFQIFSMYGQSTFQKTSKPTIVKLRISKV